MLHIGPTLNIILPFVSVSLSQLALFLLQLSLEELMLLQSQLEKIYNITCFKDWSQVEFNLLELHI